MAKLYCVPLGHSPRSLFYDKLQSVGYDKGVLVLPSRNLMLQAQREANIRTIDIDFLANTILNDNGYLGLKPLNRRSQELIIKDLVKHLAKRNKLDYFAVLAEKKGFIKALTSLVSQLSRNGVTEAQINEAFENWDRKGNLGLKDDEIKQLYAMYRLYLKSNNWVDLEGKYRLAIRVLQEDKVKLRW
jgi:ATP-dependent helicase/DNAse subunit B